MTDLKIGKVYTEKELGELGAELHGFNRAMGIEVYKAGTTVYTFESDGNGGLKCVKHRP